MDIIRELDTILFKFALTDNGAPFNRFLDSYLAVVIGHLSSPDANIKKKAMEVLSNFNKRTMFASDLQYPIDKLLTLYRDPSTQPLVRNFAIVYIEKAFNTMPKESSVNYLASVVEGLSTLPIQHQDIFSHIVCTILTCLTSMPKTDAEKDKLFPFKKNEKDCKVLLDFFLEFLMVPSVQTLKNEEGAIIIPPCHSLQSLQRMMGKNLDKYDFNALTERKVAILNFITASGVFSDTDILVHCIVASTDIYQVINKKADESLKRLPKINWENTALIDQLYVIFQGSSTSEPNANPDTQRKPASSQTREKILHYFCRSLLAANKFPDTLKIIFESVYGVETTMKLKQAAMSFVQWVFRHAEDNYIQKFGPIILSGLLKLLDSMDEESGKDINELKAFTYISLGLLCKRNKALFNKDLTLVAKLLSKIGKEDTVVASAIQDSLIMFREAFIDCKDPEISTQLISILMNHLNDTEYTTRYIVLQWAQHCFTFDNVRSRYFSLVLVGDPRPDIREEARRGLEPYEHSGNMMTSCDDPQSAIYPDFKALLDYIVERRSEIMTAKKHAQGVIHVLGYTAVSFEHILILLRTSLRKTALSLKKLPSQYLASLPESTLNNYIDLIEVALTSKAGDDLYQVSCVSLLHLLCLCPNLQPRFAGKVELLNNLMKSGKLPTRDLIAKMIGLVSCHLPNEQLDALLESYHKSVTTEKDFLEQYGPLLAFSYSVAALAHNKKDVRKHVSEERFKSFLAQIRTLFKHTNITIKSAAITAIGIIALYSPIPYASNEDKEEIIKELTKMLDASSERGVAEQVLLSLGWISLGDDSLIEMRKYMVDCLFKQVNNKNEELQFTVGDTLSLIIGGHLIGTDAIHPFSPFTVEELRAEQSEERSLLVGTNEQPQADTPMDTPSNELKNKELIATLERILTSYFSDRQSPVTRCSAGTWMLCLLKNFGSRPELQSMLTLIQNGFCSLLADNNELTQDIASKGITLVYECSNDPKFKEFLVSNLSKTLSGKPAQKAPGSSELLPEGAVGKTGQVATFKELSELSNDLGKPDMIYKFMNLSNHHQIWNSKKGASFAIVSLASKAKEEFAPLLSDLVPKIYRYMYDPSPKIASSMKNIMTSIIDSKDIFPRFFVPIIKDIIQGMGQNAWRVREASCAAIPDTIAHASTDDLLPYIEDLYYMNFRTLDDIRESIRKAAELSIKSLGTVTARMCDPTSSSKARSGDILKVVIPLLLTKGISNDSKEVKVFTVQQLQKITNTSKELIKPYVPDMVHVLLESLSNTESASFNYATFHAESLNITPEQLERARIEMSKASPLNDILEQCMKYIDQSNINQVMANVITMVQFSVGVVTRVGVAKFISNLFQSRYIVVDVPEQVLQKLITTMFPSILDKSIATRKQFVSTLAICVKKANSNKVIKQTIAQVMGLVVPNKDGEAPTVEEIVGLEVNGLFFKELYKVASSEIQSFNKDLIPFMYFFRSHPKQEVADLYKSIWEENSIGSIKLYIEEIIKLISTNLLSNSWSAKQQAALCLSHLSNDMKNSMEGHLPKVLQLLIQGLKGKTYAGKDSLLESMSTVSSVCADSIMNAPKDGSVPTALDLLTAMFAECKKNDLDYKRKALTNFASMLGSFRGAEINDLYNKIKEELYPFVFVQQEKKEKDDGMEVEVDPKQKPLTILVHIAIYNVIGQAFVASSKTMQQENIGVMDMLLVNVVHSIWNEQVSILTSLKLIMHAVWSDNQWSDEWMTTLFEKMLDCLSSTKYSVVRKATLDLIEQLIIDGKANNTILSLLGKHLDNAKKEIELTAKKDSSLGVQVDKMLLLLK
ncbi:hypothetical protein SAMD00019534_100190 [Acytostelium subglobosum LB1]|uniref:hypothetical protein n=1 Tax=Acytostelium subglobosum LB1 TaxID=1410327 RepID=UPI000644E067|nr:hypothetical protein SAMD00019534_100190 [Acytostelium subglobosum LB1]GAM26844.1 hypothetical protein SAMD00019534_100190 [Acytostelium subglobosum LB1]|eukprot:XP_012750112.1 hypothetical protein SAMD00019534_100190 [Acytostelium subglobosum LB1]